MRIKNHVKIAFMGAGSTVFAKNVLGDCLLTESLRDAEIALYDIDPARLKESKILMSTLNENVNSGKAEIQAYCGANNKKAALKGADYVINAIQVGGYKPSTVIDFEIPRKYGLRQTIADTLGIGGIFRALRTIPVVLDFAKDMEKVCPDAYFLNYVNPMAMITGALLRGSDIRTVGLCHSWPGSGYWLAKQVGLNPDKMRIKQKIAGINHQAWLLELKDGDRDLYPEIKRRAAKILKRERRRTGGWNLVRLELMMNFGYYVTESSEHTAEYVPWFIKKAHPELIREYNIPLDEYIRRCRIQISGWKKQAKELIYNKDISHKRSGEYGAGILNAIETNAPFKFGGNVMNKGLITNLPEKACVEVTCAADRKGIHPVYVGDLPEQCAALNRTNVNVQILATEAALTLKKDYIYQAALMDPHTAAELTIDQIRSMCDDLIRAHGSFLPKYK